MKSHHEQQIERAHQAGKKDHRRLHALKDFEKKTANILRHNATFETTAVQAMHDNTKVKKQQRKRKRTAAVVEKLADRSEYLKSVLELPPITSVFPAFVELAKTKYKAAGLAV